MSKNVRKVGVFLCLLAMMTFFTILVVPTFSVVEARTIKAAATFSIIADFVQQVGGDRVEVFSLVPLGGDPHTWEPTPREAREIASADILFANGAGFEVWMERLIANAARPDMPIVILSEGLTPLGSTGHDHAGGKHYHSVDPHFWLSVPNAAHYVERIFAALCEIAPENEDYFQERAVAYLQELRELDEWLFASLSAIPEENRVLVTYHNAFGYLADRYDFRVAEFLVNNPDREPSARDMAELVRLLSRMKKPVIFVEPQLGSGYRYGDTLASEVGGEVHMLYSGSLTGEVSTYLDMMYYNGETLVEALR